MNQRYNVLFLASTDTEFVDQDELVAHELTGLKQFIPQVEIVRTSGNLAVIDCPLWTEGIFVEYLEDMGCTVAKNRTYQVQDAQNCEEKRDA